MTCLVMIDANVFIYSILHWDNKNAANKPRFLFQIAQLRHTDGPVLFFFRNT